MSIDGSKLGASGGSDPIQKAFNPGQPRDALGRFSSGGGGGGAAGEKQTAAEKAKTMADRIGLPKCATEDSDNCYWDGGENGKGKSFVSYRGTLTFFEDD